MHLFAVSLEEPAAPAQEEGVSGKDRGRDTGTGRGHVVANVPGGVAGGEKAFDLQTADLDLVTVTDLARERVDPVVAPENGEAADELGELLVAPGVVPGIQMSITHG